MGIQIHPALVFTILKIGVILGYCLDTLPVLILDVA